MTFYESMNFAEKKYNFNNNKTELKMENSTHSFSEKMWFSSYKNFKLKVKL